VSAERVREFYRRQGESRQRAATIQRLSEIADNWEKTGYSKSADAIRTAILEVGKVEADVEIDQAHHEAWSAGKKHERERIIKLLNPEHTNHGPAILLLERLIKLIRDTAK